LLTDRHRAGLLRPVDAVADAAGTGVHNPSKSSGTKTPPHTHSLPHSHLIPILTETGEAVVGAVSTVSTMSTIPVHFVIR